MPAARITLPHFSTSSTRSLPNSTGVMTSGPCRQIEEGSALHAQPHSEDDPELAYTTWAAHAKGLASGSLQGCTSKYRQTCHVPLKAASNFGVTWITGLPGIRGIMRQK